MGNHGDENEHNVHNGHPATDFIVGALLGGLAGAGTMLLLAPQSGLRTRVQIRRKGLNLRDQAIASVGNAMDQARSTSQQMMAKVQEQGDKLHLEAEKVEQRAEHAVDLQKERWAPVVAAGKTAVNGS
jgi:gas vesicle protein